MKSISLLAGSLSIAFAGSGAAQAASSASEEVAGRIERVVNGLLPVTSLDNRFAPKVSLKERMAFYHTPGVSIAVINDYRIEWARGFGVKEWGKRAPVTETTLLRMKALRRSWGHRKNGTGGGYHAQLQRRLASAW